MIELTASKKFLGIERSLLYSLMTKGYTHDFRLRKNNQLLCIQNNKTFPAENVTVGLADLCYDHTTHACKYVHTIDSICGIKGLLVTEKIYLPNRQGIGLVIDKYRELSRATEQENKATDHSAPPKKQFVEERILVRYKDKIIPIMHQDIALFHLDYGLVQLVTLDNKSYFVQRSLEDLDNHLGTNFYRVNRQSLVNKLAIRDLSTSLTRSITVNLKCTFAGQITVSKLKSGDFLDWLTVNATI